MKLLLTNAERERFLAYCEHEAVTTRGIVEQMERIHTPQALVAHLRAEAAAFQVIARKLRATEAEP